MTRRTLAGDVARLFERHPVPIALVAVLVAMAGTTIIGPS